ncbi:MAG: leucine-rich repeat protein [Clostridiales bacterium]|jgi:hypothetical protein|nr:leucine-rich repeat protein [Clostridiales bacterium]
MIKAIIKTAIKAVIAVAAIFAIQVATAQPAFALENSDYRYYYGDGGIVVEFYLGNDETVYIPSSLENTPVVTVAIGCFSSTNVKNVIIPNSVDQIGARAFLDCKQLESVSIPNSVTYLGDNAFGGCSALKSIVLPNSITIIREWTFAGCFNMESITIPDSVTSIGEHAFYGNDSLKSIVIPNGVTSLGAQMFDHCVSLESISIPPSVTSFGDKLFHDCLSLTSVSIPNGVTNLGYWAFANCKSLESITIPNSVTSIGFEAFIGDDKLKSLTIPDTVTDFGTDAFGKDTTLYCSAGSAAQKYLDKNDMFYIIPQQSASPSPFPTPHLAKDATANPSSVTTETSANTSENPAKVTLQTVINPNGNISVLNKNTDSSSQFYIYEYSPNSALLGKVGFKPELPLVGSFTKDKDGNYYIAYGGSVRDDQRNAISFMIVKYDSTGKTVKTFSRAAMDTSAEKPDEDASIKESFTSGFCRLEISGDKLAAHFSRTLLRDDNQQASTGVVLDLNTLEWLSSSERRNTDLAQTNLVKRNIPYVSHSFDQFLLPRVNNSFVFVDRGDASPRAFNFSSANHTISSFEFYGGRGDNNTYSEMGGLAASKGGYVFVGSYEEGRPNASVKKLMALVLSEDLQSVSDPIWLPNSANSSGKSVESPKIAQIGANQYLVMWMSGTDTYSMVIDEKGSIASPEKKLAGVSLNTQDVLRYNPATGLVHWADSASANALRLYSYNALGAVDSSAVVPPSDGAPTYVYPADPGVDVIPPASEIVTNITPEDAAKAVRDYVSTLTEAQKTSPTGVDRLEQFAEEAASMAAATIVSDQFVVDFALVSSLDQISASAKTAVTNALVSSGVPVNRELRSVVRVNVMETTAYQPVTSLISLGAFRSGAFRLNAPAPATASNATFNVNENYSNAGADMVIIDTAGADLYISKNKVETGTFSISSPSSTTAKVDFGSAKNSVVTVAFPGQGKANDYYSVTDETGVNHGGIYDPASDSFKAKINSSGTFKVAPSEKDFTDLKSQDSEVQKAIKALASKGVINGRTATEFAPTAKITRAEIATLLVLTLKQLEPNANGNFADVRNSDWFFGAAGSSKKQGLITGYEDNTFRGAANLPKSQIYAVSARILRNEMRYATPKDINASLKAFIDATSIPDWAKNDVALATYAGLVTTRTDGKFGSEEEMTRGNAAIAVWRLYNKIF